MTKLPEFPPVNLKAGILMCLFFTVSFNLLGYTMALSIFLGIIGGLAFNLIVTWWNNPELPLPKVEETANQIGDLAFRLVVTWWNNTESPLPKVEETANQIAETNQDKLITKELPKEPETTAKSLTENQPKALSLFNWLFRQKG